MQTKHLMLGLLTSAAVGGGVAVGGYKLLRNEVEATAQAPRGTARSVHYASTMRPNASAAAASLDFVAAAAAVTPAVVHITTEFAAPALNYHPQQMDPELRQFFGDQGPEPRGGGEGSGSGVIIAANGYIVTNNHVVDKAANITVVLDDKRRFDAELVGKDPSTDLAVLKIKADSLPFAKYGDSDAVRVGEWVLAIGNPFTLNSTVTAGIISAKGRTLGLLARDQARSVESYLQTDAVINPGNSGGALVNTRGELIGINGAASMSQNTGANNGYGFAIPSKLVSKVADDLMKYGVTQRVVLGVRIQEVDASLAAEHQLSTLNGVYVQGLEEHSSAAQAGLKAGDVITDVEGTPVNNASQLQEQVARYRPGNRIKVGYLRSGEPAFTTVTLTNALPTTTVMRKPPAATGAPY